MQTVDIVARANAMLAAGNRSRAIVLKIAPRKGDATVFSNVLPDGRIDQRSIHAGLPVTHGVKRLATRWIRARRYDAWNPPRP